MQRKSHQQLNKVKQETDIDFQHSRKQQSGHVFINSASLGNPSRVSPLQLVIRFHEMKLQHYNNYTLDPIA